MVFDATFNNISVISWWSVLLVEETAVTGENHQPAQRHLQAISHNVVSNTPRHDHDGPQCNRTVITPEKTTMLEEYGKLGRGWEQPQRFLGIKCIIRPYTSLSLAPVE